jgi:hypothetical protein
MRGRAYPGATVAESPAGCQSPTPRRQRRPPPRWQGYNCPLPFAASRLGVGVNLRILIDKDGYDRRPEAPYRGRAAERAPEGAKRVWRRTTAQQLTGDKAAKADKGAR